MSDVSVCTTWGVIDRKFYLVDVFRKRLNYPDLKRAVIHLAATHQANAVLIEDKASRTQLIQELVAERMFGVCPSVPPTGMDKIMRLHAQTTLFENGHVFLPREASWLNDYVSEIMGFPGSRFDDQVDSTTQALQYLREPDPLEVWRRLA